MKKVVTIICLLLPLMAVSQQNIKGNFNHKKGVAIEGYDPVSYFEGDPKQGQEKYSSAYRGVTYWFSSDDNLQKFNESPEKFEPAYGGWCAYAMGKSGDKVKIDPETYKIVDGNLYLFYNFRNTNTLFDWNEDEDELKKEADRYWHKIVN